MIKGEGYLVIRHNNDGFAIVLTLQQVDKPLCEILEPVRLVLFPIELLVTQQGQVFLNERQPTILNE